MKNKSTVPTSFANTTVSEILFHVPYIKLLYFRKAGSESRSCIAFDSDEKSRKE